MRFRILLAFLFLGICVLALGRILVKSVRRPFGDLPSVTPPAFAAR
jgi:hypothetical protein